MAQVSILPKNIQNTHLEVVTTRVIFT